MDCNIAVYSGIQYENFQPQMEWFFSSNRQFGTDLIIEIENRRFE